MKSLCTMRDWDYTCKVGRKFRPQLTTLPDLDIRFVDKLKIYRREGELQSFVYTLPAGLGILPAKNAIQAS